MSVRVVIELDAGGCLRSVDSRGHARGASDSNVPCAAVSTIVRTAARLIAANGELAVRGDASEEGTLRCELSNGGELTQRVRMWLCGVTDFLVSGLQDVAADFPDELKLVIERETGR